ncbi:MAG: hypothetical protein ABJC12_02690 [Saprospiraceae bacterium]
MKTNLINSKNIIPLQGLFCLMMSCSIILSSCETYEKAMFLSADFIRQKYKIPGTKIKSPDVAYFGSKLGMPILKTINNLMKQQRMGVLTSTYLIL